MPVPLYPTCLDVCGCMVALGTREGPVLLFDVGPRPSGATLPSLKGGLKPRAVATAVPATIAGAAAGAASSKFGGRDGSTRGTRHGGNPTDVANAAEAAAGASTSASSGGAGRDSGSSASSSYVTRVYGSLADGTGPISSVILDRAKVVAAGRGSRRSGGGYVVRCGREAGAHGGLMVRGRGCSSLGCYFSPLAGAVGVCTVVLEAATKSLSLLRSLPFGVLREIRREEAQSDGQSGLTDAQKPRILQINGWRFKPF